MLATFCPLVLKADTLMLMLGGTAMDAAPAHAMRDLPSMCTLKR